MYEPPPEQKRGYLWLRLTLAAVVPLVVFVLPDHGPDAPGPATLLPPLFAISLAFATRRTILPLLGGVWLGAAMIRWQGGDPINAPMLAIWDVGWTYGVEASVYSPGDGVQSFNVSVIGFVFAIVGMVAIAIRAGGMAGGAARCGRGARAAGATRLATWGMGLVIFFDDYANTLIVGSSMRPLSDRMRISREKLAWIVDSTAAPVAGLSILSTWVAFEISQFSDQLHLVDLPTGAGYSVFIQTLPYRFYCIMTLVFVGLMCASGRDFGPMFKAERRAWLTGAVFRPGARPMSADATVASEPLPDVPRRAHIALVPIAVTLGAIVAMFTWRGEAAHITHGGLTGMDHVRAILQGAGDDNVTLLLWASVAGASTALLLAVGEGLLTLKHALSATVSGSRAMGVAVGVLLLAWAMSSVCADLGTREYMASLSSFASPLWLPAGLFFLACFVSFATGSSWSTMGILLPIVIQLAGDVGSAAAIEAGADPKVGALAMMLMTIGAVLDGSIFGDHCSPISDTTVLSSTAAGSDHMDHVITQVPYAVTVMLVAVAGGYLPAAAGLPAWACLGIGAAALVTCVFVLGRRPDR